MELWAISNEDLVSHIFSESDSGPFAKTALSADLYDKVRAALQANPSNTAAAKKAVQALDGVHRSLLGIVADLDVSPDGMLFLRQADAWKSLLPLSSWARRLCNLCDKFLLNNKEGQAVIEKGSKFVKLALAFVSAGLTPLRRGLRGGARAYRRDCIRPSF